MDLKHKLRFWYGIFLGVFTVVVGILFIAAAADVYYSAGGGYGMYSREVAGKKLLPLMIPLGLWIVAAIVGYVLSVLAPAVKKRGGKRDDLTALKKLRARMPAGTSEEFLQEREQFKKAEICRLAVWLICAAVWVASAIAAAVYLFRFVDSVPVHFPGINFNTDVLAMVKNVFPWFGASFLVCVLALVFESFYAKRELPRMKKLIALGKGAPLEAPSAVANSKAAVRSFLGNENTVVVIRMALLIVGVVFVSVGIFNGGMHDVLMKAIKICTECIGLG